MASESPSSVELSPVPPEGWFDRAGIAFRSILKRISDFSQDEAHTGEIATEVARKLPHLGSRALEGAATEKHAKAESDYAAAEKTRIDVQIQMQTMEYQVSQSRENAEKAAWEARSARADAFMKELQLLRLMEESNVSLDFGGSDVIHFRKRQGDVPKLIDKVLSEEDQRLLLELEDRDLS